MNTNSRPLVSRFNEKISLDGPIPPHSPELGPCWIWTGSLNEHGYGDFFVRTGYHDKAHRISFELSVGPIRPCDYILHRCDNPRCVNPSHLFVGTQADNIRDMRQKGRHRNKTFIGEQNGWAKLKTSDVLEIRKLWSTGEFTKTEIAKRFNCSRPHIANIVAGRVRSYE